MRLTWILLVGIAFIMVVSNATGTISKESIKARMETFIANLEAEGLFDNDGLESHDYVNDLFQLADKTLAGHPHKNEIIQNLQNERDAHPEEFAQRARNLFTSRLERNDVNAHNERGETSSSISQISRLMSRSALHEKKDMAHQELMKKLN